MSWNDAIDGLKTIFDLVAANSTASILSVVGISLLILAIALGLKAATMDPAKVPGWFSTAFLCTVGGAMLSHWPVLSPLFYPKTVRVTDLASPPKKLSMAFE
jgi:hypothetical protein